VLYFPPNHVQNWKKNYFSCRKSSEIVPNYFSDIEHVGKCFCAAI